MDELRKLPIGIQNFKQIISKGYQVEYEFLESHVTDTAEGRFPITER